MYAIYAIYCGIWGKIKLDLSLYKIHYAIQVDYCNYLRFYSIPIYSVIFKCKTIWKWKSEIQILSFRSRVTLFCKDGGGELVV